MPHGDYMSAYSDVLSVLRRRPWLFFALALGWSWLLWIPAILVGASQLALPGFLLYALGGLGPPAAAILLLYRKHPSQDRRDYWRRVVDFRRVGLAWYAVIAFLPLAWNVLGILTGLLFGSPVPSFERAADLLAAPLSLAPFAVVVLLLGPLPEELGWRGYALDGLLARHGALVASLILGCIWTLWHWPQFFMEDSYIAGAFPIGSAIFWAGWVLPTITSSVVYTWIYNHTEGSILSAILFHFSTNFWGEVLAVRGEMVLYRSVWIVALVILIVIIWEPETLTRQPRRGASLPTTPR
jgi:membrane protease YdiL (CAAX protease family)